MANNNVKSNILNQYAELTYFLANIMDTRHEIALLDLRPDKLCITAIINGHNSGREVGAPITDLALNFMKKETWKKQSFVCNYTGISNGKKLLSSSFFITYENELIGMFCINIDTEQNDNLKQIYNKMNSLTNMFKLILEENHIPTLIEENGKKENDNLLNETFTNDIDESLTKAINVCFPGSTIPMGRLTQDEKIQIVDKLNSCGFFLLKGSVNGVAERLNCSEASIYRYLGKIEKRKGN